MKKNHVVLLCFLLTIWHPIYSLAITQECNLKAGKNLIAFTVMPANTSIEAVLAPLVANNTLVSIWTFNSSTENWISYPVPPALSAVPGLSISSIEAGRGYELFVNADTTLTIDGTPIDALANLTISTDYQLVGFTNNEDNPYTWIFLNTPISEIWTFDDASQQFMGVILSDQVAFPLREDFTQIVPGKAYWVKARSDFQFDTDGDSLPDGWELAFGLNPNVNDADNNGDTDTLSNRGEYLAFTKPNAQDSDGDGFTDDEEAANESDPNDALSFPIIRAPTINNGSGTTNDPSVTINGNAQPNSDITISGGSSDAVTTTDGNGDFSVVVPLLPNRINRLFTSVESALGQTSASVPLEIVQDSQGPSLFIDFPENNAVLTNESIVVAGRVGDLLSGFMGLEVAVNGEPGNVIVGIGTNGTYERGDVPLTLGENTITVTAADIHGTETTKQITVTRIPLEGNKVIAVSGNLQTAQVNSTLEDPIVVRLTRPDGTPFPDKIVMFDVTRSDGRITADPNSTEAGSIMIQVRSDANGEVRAYWTLGTDAGCGNNRIAVTSQDIAGTTFFCASADPAPARQINIGSGNNQHVETGGQVTEPLRAWVNDTCNGVANIPVTYRVVQGSGSINGNTTVTVSSGITGHAQVVFTAGTEAGLNVIEASFPGNPGLPASFSIRGLARDIAVPTSFSGLVLDNAMQPIGGARCVLEIGGTSVATDTGIDGQFSFAAIDDGPGHLSIDGLVATTLNGQAIALGTFPALAYETVIIANTENSLPAPVLLPTLDPANVRVYDGTADVELTIAGIDDLKMTVKAGSMTRADGTVPSPGDTALITLNQVHFEDVPMPMPDGAAPPFAWTLQPAGATFDPPIEIIYPNMTGLPEGTVTYFLSFNHDTNRFEIVATGHIIEGGLCSVTDPGSGISTAGWGSQCPPYPPRGDHSNTNEQTKATADPGPADQTCSAGSKDKAGDPVDISIGEFYDTFEDFRIKGRGPDFIWARTYRSKIGPNTVQGNGWDYSYNIFIEEMQDDIILCNGGGRRDRFQPLTDTTWSRNELFRELQLNPDGTYSYVFEDTSKWNFKAFDGSPEAGKISGTVDRNGNTMSFGYDGEGRLNLVTDTLDRDIDIAYNGDGFIESVTDFAGRVVRYDYYQNGDVGGSFGDLKSSTTQAVTGTPNGNDFPNGKTTTFTYTTGFANDNLNHNLLTITDGRRNDPNDPTFRDGPFLTNVYTSSTNASEFNQFDRVARQIWGGDIVDFTYSEVDPIADNLRAVTTVIINDRTGNVKETFYDVRNRAVIEREYTGRANPRLPTTIQANRPINKLRATDPDFFETRYEWNQQALQARVIHPNGNVSQKGYALDADPNAPVRERGNLTNTPITPGTHTPVGDQAMIEEQFEYNTGEFNGCCGINFVTRHVDGRGNETIHAYDDQGNRIRTQHRISTIVEDWEYNEFGQVTAHVWPDNGSGHRRRDEFTYYDSGPQRGYLHEEIVDAGGFELTSTYDYDLVGNVIKKTDPRGNDTKYIINQLDQVIREISREVTDGSGIRYERDYFYDANNNIAREDIINIDDQGVLLSNSHFTKTFEYEILNHMIRTTEEVDLGHQIVTEFDYDSNRNRTLIRYGEATNGNQLTNTLSQIFDERDLLFQQIRAQGDPNQSTTEYAYDPNKNLVRESQGVEDDPRVTQYVFDSYNRPVSEVDPMGNIRSINYDANHNRSRVLREGELIDIAGSAGNIRLAEMVFSFDDMDRMITEDHEFFDTETGNQIQGGQQLGKAITTTEYSDNSQVIRIVNDNGHQALTAYDTANRVAISTDHLGNTVSYAYDENDNIIALVEVEKSDLGNPDQTFTTTKSYDGLDRLIQTIDNIGNTHDYGYDSRNNRTLHLDALRTAPSEPGNKKTYTYDGLNRLTQTTCFLTSDGTGSGGGAFGCHRHRTRMG